MLFQSKTKTCDPLMGKAIKVLFFFAGISSAHFGLTDLSELARRTEIDASIPDHADNGKKPWTSLETLDSDNRFHFAIVTDRTGERD